jgi:N-methylhydantoinase A
VVEAARAVGAEQVERFTHGTTVATSALLERTGARTALVTTAEFEHVLRLRRQTRASLYRLCAAHPVPLVPLERHHHRDSGRRRLRSTARMKRQTMTRGLAPPE